MNKVTEQIFKELLQAKLGKFWNRALVVFQKYGPRYSFDVANVLLHAVDKRKTSEIIDALEEHIQNPDSRHTVTDRILGTDPTVAMFHRAFRNIPGIELLGQA